MTEPRFRGLGIDFGPGGSAGAERFQIHCNLSGLRRDLTTNKLNLAGRLKEEAAGEGSQENLL